MTVQCEEAGDMNGCGSGLVAEAEGMPDLSVGEVASRSGVAVSALHFYEKQGLIESARTAGNQRRYARAVLRRVAVIKVAQRMGVPLAEIAQALAHLPANRVPGKADMRHGSLSDGCSSSLAQSIVRPSSLGGVPVFNRAIGRSASRS